MPPFYATATVVLVALLVTWLVAEAQGSREDLAKKRRGDPDGGQVWRMSRRSMLPIALALLAGVVAALWVQFRGHVGRWEPIVVWAALGLGLLGVTLSLVLNIYERVELTVDETLLRTLRVGKRWGPIVAAAVFGVLASPLFHREAVRYVGARFAVYGTCSSEACGLKQRKGPGPGFQEAEPHTLLYDGTKVLVVCQTLGPPPRGKYGYTSHVWDRLENGNYVSDVFVLTPDRSGGFSSGLPRCDRGNRRGTVG